MSASIAFQLAINIFIFCYVSYRAQLKSEDFILYFIGAMLMAFLSYSLMQSLPLAMLFGMGLGLIIMMDKKRWHASHEGAVLLSALTALYVIATMEGWLRIFLLIAIGPLLILLAMEVWHVRLVSTGSRMALGILYSLCCGLIGFYQVGFFNDLVVLEAQELNFEFMLRSFLIQLTLFWAFFYVSRFWLIIPPLAEKKPLEKIKKEVVPEFTCLVGEQNIPPRLLLIALLIHGLPLLANFFGRWLQPQMMVSYALIFSPVIVDQVLKRQKQKGEP